MQNQIKDEIQAAVNLLYKHHIKTDDINLEQPAQKGHGNLASNVAFILAREFKKNPAEIAVSLAGELEKTGVFEKVESAGGFINFFLKKEKYINDLKEILSQEGKFGSSDLCKGQKIQVEFISANPTGPLTMANSRGGFSGDVLANIFTKVGAEIEREYYVNDGGNQVKILGESILAAAGLLKRDEDIYRGEYIEKWVRENKEEVTKLKDDPFKLGQLAAQDILNGYIKPAAKKMKINFDQWFSEDEMIKRGEVEQTIQKLKEYGLTKEQEGALWMQTTKFGDDKDRVLVKSDGEKTYFANDVAYHFDKLYKRKFDKIVDIWGADHHGYIGRLLASVEAMDCPGKVQILITQLVRLVKDGKEYRMSKRKGVVVTIDDLLELIGGPEKEASDVARFFFLSRSFNTHMDFDLNLAREHSEKNPVFYVKYAYARIHGILANAKDKIKNTKPNYELLGEEAELELISEISKLPQVIEFIASSTDYSVHNLTFYATEIAKKFHYFYDKCRVIDEENPELTAARLELVRATQIVLGIVGRDLIGIEMPEKM